VQVPDLQGVVMMVGGGYDGLFGRAFSFLFVPKVPEASLAKPTQKQTPLPPPIPPNPHQTQTLTHRSSPADTATAASTALAATHTTPPACPVSVCPVWRVAAAHVSMRLSPHAAKTRRPSAVKATSLTDPPAPCFVFFVVFVFDLVWIGRLLVLSCL
jgi:hypothetical protein